MKHERQSFKQIQKAILALTVAAVCASTPVGAAPSDFGALTATAQNNSQNDFDRKFREGRELIDREDWARAAAKFDEIIGKYSTEKSADAALYWLAFCRKKQKQFKDADAALDRLIREFPASSWTADARVMKMEIAAPLGRTTLAGANSLYSAAVSGIHPNAAQMTSVSAAPARSSSGRVAAGLSEIYTTAARTPLDREDEIKIAAFQSLLAADPRRAIETMGEILTAGSRASEVFKQEVLRVVRSRHLSINQATGSFTTAIGKEFVPLLRETLLKSFRNETNLKIRKEIIYTLANSADEQSTDHLRKLYEAENDREIKKTIINAFGGSANVFYGFNSNAAPKRKVETDALLEIIRAEKDAELRRLAFSAMQRFSGFGANAELVQAFVRLYDAEPEEELKILIVRTFANSKQNQATMKLLEIARNDKSDKLKLEAIYALRNSKDPEVLKFLQDLIR